MIRFIVVMDSKRGMANEHGIPWQGKLPSDIADFRRRTMNSNVLMGYATYEEFSKPLNNRKNFVATSKTEPLRPGFEPVADARSFLQQAKEDIWVIGGAGLFTSTLDLADELYITMLDGEYGATKFFPEYEDKFELVSKGPNLTENGITFRFTVWKRK